MGVLKTSNPFSDKAGELGQNTMQAFGNQATGNVFRRESDSIFGAFPRQNSQSNETINSSSAFGTQPTFGSNSFQNQGCLQPRNFGFGRTMAAQITEIWFTGFGEAKESYNFSNSPGEHVKKITLVFKNSEIGSIFGKPDTRVEIEGWPTNNLSTWTSNANDFSFSVGHVEKYNSSFVMKSARPMKFSVKVKSGGSIFGFGTGKQKEFGSSSNTSGNRKITLTFQSDQYFTSWNNFPRLSPSTVVEIPLKDDSELRHEGFAFSVGPTGTCNSFEVQTQEKSVFNVTFLEKEKFGLCHPFGNRITRNGPVFFDQGRQLNPFPSSNGLFGQSTPAFGLHPPFGSTPFGSNPPFGSIPVLGSYPSFGTTHSLDPQQSCATLTRGYDTFQDRPLNTIPTTGNLLFGQTGNTCFQPTGSNESSPFGEGNSGGALFGHSSNNINSQPLFGNGNCESNAFGSSHVCGSPYNRESCKQPSNQGKRHQMQPAPNVSISIFGNNQPTVCSDNFGTPAFADLTTGPIFGQLTNANDNSRASAFGAHHLFGNSKTPTNTEFSVHGNQHIGLAAAVKYQPTIGCDILANGGSPVQTKTHCITAMKEHANKSLEELRMESYFEELLRFEKYKENKMANPHRYKQESTFWGYTPSHNMIGNIYGSAIKQPFDGQGTSKCIQSSNVSNKVSFANDDKIRKLRRLGHPNDNKSANEFYEDVFKYMDYIRKQYGHLENTVNNKNTNNASESHTKEYATHKSNEATTFGSSTCSAAKIRWGENQSPIASGSINCGIPNALQEKLPPVSVRVAVRPTKLPSCSTAANTNNTNETSNGGTLFGNGSNKKAAQTFKMSLTSKSLDATDANYRRLPVLFNPDKQHDVNAKPKECEQPNDIKKGTDSLCSGGENPSGIFTSTVSNNKASNFVFFPMFSPKDSGNLDESNASNSGVATSKANDTGPFSSTTAFNDKPDALFTKSSLISTPCVLGEELTGTCSSIVPNDLPASKGWTSPFCSTKVSSKTDNIFGKLVFSNVKGAYYSKERENLEKETNVVGDSVGLKFAKHEDSLQSFEAKDNEPIEAEKYNSVQLEDVPMDEQDGFGSTIQPTNPQALKMKKISEELAALVVDGCENEANRKDSDAGSDISNYSIISNQSLDEDGKAREHPTGIVMTRSGYYTVPSLEELKSQMSGDGRCTVSNFKIGRKGYGNILFNKEINVAGLNVDEIVHFRNKEIIIYPGENNQLLVDANLNNCEALITLEQVWPHDKTRHEPMKDPQRLDEMKYEEKLRLVCDKNDIQFVEYLPETGQWVFKMKRFAKTNINCWDEEDDAPEILNNSTEPPEIKKFRQNVIADTDNEYHAKPSI